MLLVSSSTSRATVRRLLGIQFGVPGPYPHFTLAHDPLAIRSRPSRTHKAISASRRRCIRRAGGSPSPAMRPWAPPPGRRTDHEESAWTISDGRPMRSDRGWPSGVGRGPAFGTTTISLVLVCLPPPRRLPQFDPPLLVPPHPAETGVHAAVLRRQIAAMLVIEARLLGGQPFLNSGTVDPLMKADPSLAASRFQWSRDCA